MLRHIRKGLVIAGIALGAMNTQAAVITFDDLVDSNFATTMPLLGNGDEFYQSGFWLSAASNQPDAMPGDLVGAIVDGADVANTCFSVVCPGNNGSHFFTALNDGYFALGLLNNQSFNLTGFDASFVAAFGELVPEISLILRVLGHSADNSGTLTNDFYLSGLEGGELSFETYVTDSLFASTQFDYALFYGFACDGSGLCTAFGSDKGQFALDNINVSEHVTDVSEPATLLLFGFGLVVAGMRRRSFTFMG